MLCTSSGTWTSRTRQLSTQLTFCAPADHTSDGFRSYIWFCKMASNSLDLYFSDCMMRSKITTGRNNVMINGQGGESTCQKLIWLPLPIRRYLKMFDVNSIHLQKANQRQQPKPSAVASAKASSSTTTHQPEAAPPAKTGSSVSTMEGWKRLRERWQDLFTPWRRLELFRILRKRKLAINSLDLCIGPDMAGGRVAISAHDWSHHHCEWILRGIWAG